MVKYALLLGGPRDGFEFLMGSEISESSVISVIA